MREAAVGFLDLLGRRISLDGEIAVLAEDFGGLSLGRPYGGGQYSVSKNDRFAFTVTSPSHPADQSDQTPVLFCAQSA